ncbi:spermine/spermidine acetyltransferase [Rhizobium freirei PRF 81]|uniref:Spermine/spermidine acetyltransferase n=1 Tax=Rhizobium freirei PRF 81 TaxID=363754 RepID=N6V4S8_9HYPH|nr:GNAT family N-acetyltransferase [Rhizobium freirei]ENN88880.1 spermine/spermidine acetyltransferase [Rhizobium freirei PRF 81]
MYPKQNPQLHAADLAAVTLERVTREDYQPVLSLRPHDHQTSYVASNEESLEEAEENPACVPLIIRVEGEPVGFAMYALDEDDGNYWIYRLMIDGRFQGRGYGRAALIQIVSLLAEIPECLRVVLGVHPENEKARRLYEHVGFRLTDDVINGELVMRYDFQK